MQEQRGKSREARAERQKKKGKSEEVRQRNYRITVSAETQEEGFEKSATA
jgi:hypothetical protein